MLNDFTNNSGSGMPPFSGMPFSVSGVPATGGVQEMLINYNERHKNDAPIRFREELVNQCLSILIGAKKPNTLLIGPAGCGKTAVVEEIARRLAAKDPSIPDTLKDHIIYELPLSSIVAGSSFVGEIEQKLKDVLAFAADPDEKCILFMDEIHQLESETGSYSKIAQILKPALARGDIRVIGATTAQEEKSLRRDPAFCRRFSRLNVDELTPQQTCEILKDCTGRLQKHYQNRISLDESAIQAAVALADQYGHAGNHRPDNAITLVDRAMAQECLSLQKTEHELEKQAQDSGDTMVLDCFRQSLPAVLTRERLENCAKSLLTGNATAPEFDEERFEKALSIIQGQDEVCAYVKKKIRRYSRGLFVQEKPVSWLFAGTSGTGKSEMAKIIARELTGRAPIILNMTEYSDPMSLSKLIGSSAGYIGSDSNAEKPLDALITNPYQIILLDEFEKAHPSIQKIFMQALDEGTIVTNQNETLDFSKSIMIFTTNAGEKDMLQNYSFGITPRRDLHSLKAKTDVLSRSFDLALLNRFEKTLFFNTLDEATYKEIVRSTYGREAAAVKLRDSRITLADEINEDDLETLCQSSYDIRFGARPALKTVRNYIEDQLDS